MRGFLLTLVLLQPALKTPVETPVDSTERPNIVLILVDDQGYGDFGFLGNDEIKTPHLDRMAARSTWMTNFYVTPVCSTTRASLMTGHYNQRAGVLRNGSPMFADEITLAESLQQHGYATGMFGKWHLGRHYPLRPMEQGFDEVLSFRGGVLREEEKDAVDVRYTDPMLVHNGELVRQHGFETDLFFDAALEWMGKQVAQRKPFFAYISPAAPHRPYSDLPGDSRALYSAEQEQRLGKNNIDIYALISKIDENMGKLFEGLTKLHISKKTVVIYLSDNGPANLDDNRFMGGLRGHKGDVLEGGIKTPLLVHWSGVLNAQRIDDARASVIDLVPTLLDICGASPERPDLDGISLWKLWRNEVSKLPDRDLIFQSNANGDLDSNYAVIRDPWKLVFSGGYTGKRKCELKLYNLRSDPGESRDLGTLEAETLTEMQTSYRNWVKSLLNGARSDRFRLIRRVRDGSKARHIYRSATRISIDSPLESPILLTKQHGPAQTKSSWLLEAKQRSDYNIRLRFQPQGQACQASLVLQRFEGPYNEHPFQKVERKIALPAGGHSVKFDGIDLAPGVWRLTAKLIPSGPTDEIRAQSNNFLWQVLITPTP